MTLVYESREIASVAKELIVLYVITVSSLNLWYRYGFSSERKKVNLIIQCHLLYLFTHQADLHDSEAESTFWI